MGLRSILVVCTLLFVGYRSLYAQTATVVCGSTIYAGEEVSFSVGQAVVFETESESFSLIAGVQQPFVSLFTDMGYVVGDSKGGVVFYPNPVSTLLHVVYEEMEYSRLCIYNTAGALVISSEILTKQTSVDMSRLSPGLYYVQLIGEVRTEFFKIIKE